jgi:hypothetical protein
MTGASRSARTTGIAAHRSSGPPLQDADYEMPFRVTSEDSVTISLKRQVLTEED